jgi:divalent metal cation (Fe/Co/Zn/Cd) transporter
MESLGFALSFGAGFIQLGLLIFVIIAAVGARAEEDPDGERAAGIYYNGVLFLAVFAVLFAAFVIVVSLLNLTIDKGGNEFFSVPGSHDADWNAAVHALLAGVVAAGLYFAHDRRRTRRSWTTPGRRIRRTYLYLASFVAVVIATVAVVAALWTLWGIVAPGVAGAGPRSESLISLASTLFLAAGALFIVWTYVREAEPELPFRGPTTAALIPPEPPPPPPIDLTPAPAPAPRKRAAVKKAPAKKAAKRT